jgi:hypothetical protein
MASEARAYTAACPPASLRSYDTPVRKIRQLSEVPVAAEGHDRDARRPACARRRDGRYTQNVG